MTSPRSQIHAGPDGTLAGIQVIGFHGEMDASLTPARRGPVYADAEGHLVKILHVKQTGDGFLVRVDVDDEPLSADDPLPGVGTRIGPWPARLGGLVMGLGTSERSNLERLRSQTPQEEPPRVEPFVQWLASDEPRSEALTCDRLGKLVAWYCVPAEAAALQVRIHAVAEEDFFRAVGEGDKHDLERASFRLSRAKVADQDLYLAAAGLKRAGHPRWEIMLKEGLRLPDPASWKEGLARATELLANPPRFGRAEHQATQSGSFRDRLRGRTLVPRAGRREAA